MFSLNRLGLFVTAIGVFCLAGLPRPARAAERRLAVLEFQGKKLDDDVLNTFSDAVRGGVVDALAGRPVLVMTRENMVMLLKEMGRKGCTEGDCEVETGRNIGADYVVSGAVARIDQSLILTLKLHETKSGGLLGTEMVEGTSQMEVLRQLGDRSRELIETKLLRRPDSRASAREPVAQSPRPSQALAGEAIAPRPSQPPAAPGVSLRGVECPLRPEFAQDRQALAREWSSRGDTAQNGGEYSEAVRAYACSMKLLSHPQTALKLARAAELSGELDMATNGYRAYLALNPDAPDADQIQARIRVIQNRGRTRRGDRQLAPSGWGFTRSR
jgi:TolB-like protein